ncbi:hypothetical protein B0T26DRAFT_196719 [Lasiosphaeria miniovina]|uniref:TauD/TfdA-like domain-containing protein n=1 Tax=Lasiosphaeria miniovina TaxID=1954250 RepID=A0AA40E482_9PEZI|nr:uncharacterized protein B0T26DRAFT_196719 [Lasiosphaeria miniovina]KAK0721968.1 hypothetical protein B0T26DRAFT_196719 [Lasiosphaeria miniovina]
MACPLGATPAREQSMTATETQQTIVRPDIEWIPSYKVYKERVERLAALNLDRPTTLPPGWPSQVDTERAWSRSDFKSEDEYILKFSEEDIAEIEAGLAYFKSLPGDLGPDDVNRDTFPLPSLGSRLGDVSKTIHDGRGFTILRGLEPDKYSSFDNILLYLGVTSYIAETRGMQDFDGRMILHIQAIVEDVKKHGSMPNSPYVARAQPFHTDLCDVLALYALDVAAYGGESFLASSAKIYNEIAKTRPDIIHVLARDDWPFDEFWQGEYHTRPLLYNFGEHGPGFQFSRRPLTGAHFSPHHPAVPAMTEVQAEALDTVYFLAKQHAVELALRRGDIELFNNFAMLHARSGFADAPGPAGSPGKRHMLRLWLRNEQRMWPVPRALARVSDECYGDNEYRRNAIWDIEKSPPELRIKHRRASCA